MFFKKTADYIRYYGLSATAVNMARLAGFYIKRLSGGKYALRRINDRYDMYLDLLGPGISRPLYLYGTRELDQVSIVLEELKEGMRVLDVGANIGIFVRKALENGYDAKGIDLNKNAVLFANAGITDKVYEGGLKEEGGLYDIITLEQVLEHIKDPLSFLNDARVRLKEGGLLIISVPNYSGIYPGLFKNDWYGWWPKEHVWHYSVKGLDYLIRKAGFKKIKVYHSNLYYFFNSLNLKNLLKYAVSGLSPYFLRGDKIFYAAEKN